MVIFGVAIAILLYKYSSMDNMSFIILAAIFGYLLYKEMHQDKRNVTERFVELPRIGDLPLDIKNTIVPKLDYLINGIAGGDTTAEDESQDDFDMNEEYFIEAKDPLVTKEQDGKTVIDEDKYKSLRKQYVVLDGMFRMLKAVDPDLYFTMFPRPVPMGKRPDAEESDANAKSSENDNTEG